MTYTPLMLPHTYWPPPSTIKIAKLYDSQLCCSPKTQIFVCSTPFALLVYMPIDVYVPPLQRPSLTCLTNTSTTLTVRVISRHSPHNRDQRQLVCVCESALYATGQSRDMFLAVQDSSIRDIVSQSVRLLISASKSDPSRGVYSYVY